MVILYKNARLKGKKELTDILVEDGVIKEIGNDLISNNLNNDKVKEIYDLEGNLVLPPYVDPHIHLDYVFTAKKEGALNDTGTLFEGIQRWSETKSDLNIEEIKERARLGIKKKYFKEFSL